MPTLFRTIVETSETELALFFEQMPQAQIADFFAKTTFTNAKPLVELVSKMVVEQENKFSLFFDKQEFNPFEVVLQIAANELRGSCACGYFMGHKLCKHIAAAMIYAKANNIVVVDASPKIPIYTPQQLKAMSKAELIVLVKALQSAQAEGKQQQQNLKNIARAKDILADVKAQFEEIAESRPKSGKMFDQKVQAVIQPLFDIQTKKEQYDAAFLLLTFIEDFERNAVSSLSRAATPWQPQMFCEKVIALVRRLSFDEKLDWFKKYEDIYFYDGNDYYWGDLDNSGSYFEQADKPKLKDICLNPKNVSEMWLHGMYFFVKDLLSLAEARNFVLSIYKNKHTFFLYTQFELFMELWDLYKSDLSGRVNAVNEVVLSLKESEIVAEPRFIWYQCRALKDNKQQKEAEECLSRFLSHLSAAKQFKHFMDILPDMFSALKQILRGKNPRLYFEFVMLYDTSEVAKAAFEPLGDVLPNLNNKSKEEIFYEKYRNQYPEDAANFYKKMIGLALPRGKQDCYELILRMLSCLSKIPKEKETLLHLINVMIETYPNRQVFVNMLKEYIKVLVLNPW